jgi:hypothetical protein
MASTAIASLSNYIVDELPRVIHESLPTVAPFFKDIVSTSVGVKADSSQVGQLWRVNHLYSAGIAGLIKYADPTGPTTITQTGGIGTQVKLLNFTADSSIYPTAREAPHAGSLKRTLTLHMTTGNFSVPVTWMQADALNMSQIKQVSQDIKAVGDLKATVEATGFHAIPVTAASGFEVKVMGMLTNAVETGTDIVRITIDEAYGTIHNFRVGMAIDIVAGDRTSGGTLQDGVALDGTDIRNVYGGAAGGTYLNLFITNVNYLARTFDCVGIGNSSGALVSWTDDATGTCLGSWGVTTDNDEVNQYDYIVQKDCSQYVAATRPMPTWGIEDWVKSTGTIMGGASGAEALDVDTFSQFRSLVQAVNGPLTDDVLNKYVGNYLDSYPGLSLDTIITTNGVTQNYLKQFGLYNNRKFYDSQGKSLDAKGGWSEVAYEFNGRMLRWIVDPMCAAGRLYAMKFQGGNIKRYQPPTISGSGPISGGAGTDGEVQFLAPLGGHTGVFMLGRTTGGAVMDVLEAPFHQYNLIAPIDPRGIKLTSITEVART